MSTADSLNKALEKLSEELEDKPDPWFNKPHGYLLKPDFKREQQTPDYIASGRDMNIFARFSGLMGTYKKRWFVLSPKECILRYFVSADLSDEKGFVDLKDIDAVDYSHVRDAGKNSIDLISEERHFTLTANSREEMHKWALALKRCLRTTQAEKHEAAASKASSLPSYTRESVTKREVEISGEAADAVHMRWHRYDFTYELPGPMCMHVMGSANKDQYGNLLNQWVIVTAFELTLAGEAGPSEASGLIAVKDYVIGVNGIDLTTSTFNDAMDTIAEAEFPKTLHFLRDNEASKEGTRIESWVTVYYPALNRRRRRYCEIKSNMINFRKPGPGGAANGERDAFFILDHVAKISPIRDLNLSGSGTEEEFILQLHCKPDSTVQHVGGDDMSVGGSPVYVLELCFGVEPVMNQWRSILASPQSFGKANVNIPTDTMLTIPKGEVYEHTSSARALTSGRKELTTVLLESKDIAIKSTLTGNLTPRVLTLTSDGYISWRRPPTKGKASSSSNAAKKLFIADGQHCKLVKVIAQETDLGTDEGDSAFCFQLGIQTTENSVVFCFTSAAHLQQWLAAIEGSVSAAPKLTVPPGLLPFNREVEKVDAENAIASDGSKRLFEVYGDGNKDEEEEADYTFKGYLYKRNDLLLPKGFSPQAGFAKVWVQLENLTMYIYRSQIEVQSGVLPFLTLPLGTVIEVHEATDAGVPENSFEIVTVEKVYIFSATDEDAMLLWLEAVSDMIEARDMAVNQMSKITKGSAALSSLGVKSTQMDDYVQQIKKAILFSGGVTMKSVNLYTGFVSWRDRFIVLTSGSLAYYGDAKDVFTAGAESIGDINLGNIQYLCTCSPEKEAKVQRYCAFEMTAFVTKGGDGNNMRVFVFEARTPELCKQWMESIANATGRFDIVPHPSASGHFHSVESAEKMKERARDRARTVGGRGQGLARKTGAGGGAGRGAAFSQARVSTVNTDPEVRQSLLEAQKPPGGMDEEEERVIRARAASTVIPTVGRAAPQAGGAAPTPAPVRVPAPGAGPGGRGAGRVAGRGFSAPQRKVGNAGATKPNTGPRNTQL